MTQNHYLVIWEIDIYADNPTDAARGALTIQRNPNSDATVFEVTECPYDEFKKPVIVDLGDET